MPESDTPSPNFHQADGCFHFQIPGRHLTSDSPMSELEQARQVLRDQTAIDELYFPIPAGSPIDLMVEFYNPVGLYPGGFEDGFDLMQRMTVARELTQGIVYQDHSCVASKQISMRETSQEEGFTVVRVRVLGLGGNWYYDISKANRYLITRIIKAMEYVR